MAEEFINEIYVRAELIYVYKQCSELLSIRDYGKFSKLWTSYSEKILQVLGEIRTTDIELSERFEKMIYGVVENVKDAMLAQELIENGIVPTLYQYMSEFGGIDVTENEWQLKSSKSGYLTMYNSKAKCHTHSLDNPMWEAHKEAKALYEGKYDSVLIFGAGLGYLAKALWEQSEKSLDIYIFEVSKKIEEYARSYGVVDAISEDKLHYIVKDNPFDVYCEFIEKQMKCENTLVVVSDWIADYFDEPLKSNISVQSMSEWVDVSFKNNYSINFWRNKKKFTGEFSELENKFVGREFIAVAAGPSLDDNIEYIKTSVGKKIIVCVNTVLKRLLREGIKPDYVCLIDPTVGVFPHVEGIEEQTKDIPLIAESLAYWKFLDVYRGPIYRVFGANYYESIEMARSLNEKAVDLGSTVSNLVIEAAVKMGARRIELVGMDLSFPGDKQYAGSNRGKANNTYQDDYWVKANDGNTVRTVNTFNVFRNDIEKQIVKYGNVEFINLSKHGAIISGSMSGGWIEYCVGNVLGDTDVLRKEAMRSLLRIGGILPNVREGIKIYRDELNKPLLAEYTNSEEREIIISILSKWRENAQAIGDVAALMYLDTTILNVEFSSDVLEELLDKLKNCDNDYRSNYFWYCQLQGLCEKIKAEFADKLTSYLSDLKQAIVCEINKQIPDELIAPISEESHAVNSSFVFINQLRQKDIENGAPAMEKAIRLIEMGRQVLLVNTSEKYPLGLNIPIYAEKTRENLSEYISEDTLSFGDKSIPYFQSEDCMPDTANIRLFIEYLRKVNPRDIIAYCSDSPMLWVIEQFTKVVYFPEG